MVKIKEEKTSQKAQDEHISMKTAKFEAKSQAHGFEENQNEMSPSATNKNPDSAPKNMDASSYTLDSYPASILV